MKWKDLTPKHLDAVALDLFDDAHDAEVDREFMTEERGFDVVAAMECVGRRLQRESTRRTLRFNRVVVSGDGWRIQISYDERGWTYAIFNGSSVDPYGAGEATYLPSLFNVLLDGEVPRRTMEMSKKLDEALPKLLRLRRDHRRYTGQAEAVGGERKASVTFVLDPPPDNKVPPAPPTVEMAAAYKKHLIDVEERLKTGEGLPEPADFTGDNVTLADIYGPDEDAS